MHMVGYVESSWRKEKQIHTFTSTTLKVATTMENERIRYLTNSNFILEEM